MNYNDLEINTYYMVEPTEYIVLYRDKDKMIWLAKRDEKSEWRIWIWTRSDWENYGNSYQNSESVGFLEDLFTYEEVITCLFLNGVHKR